MCPVCKRNVKKTLEIVHNNKSPCLCIINKTLEKSKIYINIKSIAFKFYRGY